MEHFSVDQEDKGQRRSLRNAQSMLRDRDHEIGGAAAAIDYVKRSLPVAFLICCALCAVVTTYIVTMKDLDFKLAGAASTCTLVNASQVICPLDPSKTAPDSCYMDATLKLEDKPGCPVQLEKKTAEVPAWKAIVVCNTITLTIFLTILGKPTALLMMMACTLFVFCGIITEAEAFAGFGSNGMIALAILFILSKAVEWSGLFDAVVFKILGSANSIREAQLRLMPAVAVMATFINNTPLVAMMLPMIMSWAKQRDLDAMRLVLPVGYVACLGAMFSKIGSSTNMVAGDYQYDPRLPFEMKFFDLAPVGLVLVITCIVYTVLVEPFLLSASVQPAAVPTPDVTEERLYTVPFQVTKDSEMVGKSWRLRGLHRLPLTKLVDGPGHGGPDEMLPMEPGSRILVCTDAEGIAALRRVYGLVIAEEAGDAILARGSTKIRQRRLFEALLVEQNVADLQSWLLDTYGAALVAARGRALTDCMPQSRNQILLLDAHHDFEKAASSDFAMVRLVPDSAPLRVGRRADPWRAWTSLVLMGTVVFLATLGIKNKDGNPAMPLASLCLWATAILVGLDIMTDEEALKSINAGAWLSLCSAFGLGKGMQKSGVADGLALGLVSAAQASGLGLPGIGAGIFFTASVLSNLMSNTATTLMMLPIVERIALEECVPIKTLVCFVLFGANCVFATPIGTSTNMVVQAPGGPGAPSYSFGDYIKFGLPLQFVTLVIAVPAVIFVYGTELPPDQVCLNG